MKHTAILVDPTPINDPQSLGGLEPRTIPTVDDVNFALRFTVEQIENSFRGTGAVLLQMENGKVDAIIFRTDEAFGQMRAPTFARLLGVASRRGESSGPLPLVAVLTKDNRISGPAISLHCRLVQPASAA